MHIYETFYFINRISSERGVVVILLVYHAGDPGSIPAGGRGGIVFFFFFFFLNFEFFNVTRVQYGSTLSFNITMQCNHKGICNI